MQLGEKQRGHLGFSLWSPSHWIGDRWSEWKLAVSEDCFGNQKEIRGDRRSKAEAGEWAEGVSCWRGGDGQSTMMPAALVMHLDVQPSYAVP